MRRHFGLGFAPIAFLIFGGLGAASAADLPMYKKAPPSPVVAVYNWTGWYAGVNGGYSWDNSTGSLVAFTTAPAAASFAPAVAAGGTPSFLGAKHEGGFGGGQVGYNWQQSYWLVGLEADIQGASIGGTSTIGFPGGGGIVPSVSTGRDHVDWFGTFRGRAGVTYNSFLFYGTGGLAYGGVRSSVTNIFTPGTAGTFAGSASNTIAGWVAGAGVEWGFAPNWTVKAEYLHIDLGHSNVTMADPVNFPISFATYRFHHELDTVRVGVNYRFGGPIVARY
jgi:outer membrane immunogenic protein